MGMPKINRRAEDLAVQILKRWPAKQKVTWESFRDKLGSHRRDKTKVWSRQALGKNEAISSAFRDAKLGHRPSTAAPEPGKTRKWYAERVETLEGTVEDLKKKLDALQTRHTQLIYNASFLPGGASLLVDPLPDNTRSQSA